MLLIKDGILIPCDGSRKILQNHSVAVEDDRIVDIGKSSELVKKYGEPDKVIDAKRKLIIPGFINTHTHLFQVLCKGLGMDKPLDTWWESSVRRVAPLLGPEECYKAALLGCVENIKSGVTCVNDFMYLGHRRGLSDGVVKAFKDVGVRGVLSKGIVDAIEDRAPELNQPLEDGLREFRELLKRYHNSANGRVRVWIAPSSIWGTSYKAFKESIQLARELGTWITYHCSEAEFVVKVSKQMYGGTETEILARDGLLAGDMLAVHCVWVSENDISLMARHGVKVSHCPVSNMILSDGVAPVEEMLNKGVVCSLGTDGPASNNNQDMIAVIKNACLLQKVHLLKPTALSAWKALEMATIDGAKAMGMENEIGSIEVGKKADITIINLENPFTAPTYDPVASLVYSATPENVETVIIDGKIVMEERRMKTVDENNLVKEVYEIGERIMNKIGG